MKSIKKCPTCGETKDIEQFYKRQSDKRSSCKLCERKAADEWRDNNKEKQAAIMRRANWRRGYGITEEQYNDLLEKQNHSCAICNRHKDQFKRWLCVDHNHATGEIRGLLCDYCNHRVIGRHRDGELLRKMASYVEQGTGWFVPKRKPKKRRRNKA